MSTASLPKSLLAYVRWPSLLPSSVRSWGLILSVIIYAQALVDILEVITGPAGAVLIGVSLWSSIRHNVRAGASFSVH